jgi:hypothetical protein
VEFEFRDHAAAQPGQHLLCTARGARAAGLEVRVAVDLGLELVLRGPVRPNLLVPPGNATTFVATSPRDSGPLELCLGGQKYLPLHIPTVDLSWVRVTLSGEPNRNQVVGTDPACAARLANSFAHHVGIVLDAGPLSHGRYCHSTLSLTVIDCQSSGIYTVILL